MAVELESPPHTNVPGPYDVLSARRVEGGCLAPVGAFKHAAKEQRREAAPLRAPGVLARLRDRA